MARIIFYVSACLLAALAPLGWASGHGEESKVKFGSASFPTEFEGRRLTSLELSEREINFGAGFPGHTRRFTDGEREIIVRQVFEATRKLHPAADCFRGTGYEVAPLPMRVGADNSQWSCFRATRGADRLRVCERIYDSAGGSWTDVSAWYWAAMWTTDKTSASWWAITIAERDESKDAD